MTQRTSKRNPQCCAIVGAGDLVGHIWRLETDQSRPEYGFTIGRLNAIPGTAVQVYQPSDLESFPKLLQVLAREFVHDGGFEVKEKAWLDRFADEIKYFGSRMNSGTSAHLTCHDIAELLLLLREMASGQKLTKTKREAQRYRAQRLTEMLQNHLLSDAYAPSPKP